jgi:hypothetical protein
MKMRFLFAVLVLGLISTSAQASCGGFVNQEVVVTPECGCSMNRVAFVSPVVLVPAYHLISPQIGTGLMVVGRHTGFNYDRMAQDMRHPQGAVMSYGSGRPLFL